MTLNDARVIKQVTFGEWGGADDKARARVRAYLVDKGYAVSWPSFRVKLEAAERAAEILAPFGQQQEAPNGD